MLSKPKTPPSFAHEPDKLYNPTEGRLAWEPVMLFCCLLLAIGAD
jgi:hypothetical protein